VIDEAPERDDGAVELVRTGIDLHCGRGDRRSGAGQELRRSDLRLRPGEPAQRPERQLHASDDRRGLEMDQHVRQVANDAGAAGRQPVRTRDRQRSIDGTHAPESTASRRPVPKPWTVRKRIPLKPTR